MLYLNNFEFGVLSIGTHCSLTKERKISPTVTGGEFCAQHLLVV